MGRLHGHIGHRPGGEPLTKAAVGGTFNVLHAGHLALIQRAFQLADHVIIGITSDEYAGKNRRRVNPLSVRCLRLEEALRDMGGNYTVQVISDPVGPAGTMDDLDLIIVSEETYHNAATVNEARARNGLKQLHVEMVPMVLTSDGIRLSASEIINGRYDRTGGTECFTVAVGSLNPVKVEAVRTVMESIYGRVRVLPVEVDSEVPDQPWGLDTLHGARNRSRAAILDCDLSVGIEAGVFEKYDGLYDTQHCAILDKSGRYTYGAGMSFRYPDRVAELVRNGSTVGEAVAEVFHVRDSGDAEGAIGIITRGIIDRKVLTEQSIYAAMVPRIRDDYVDH